MTPVHDGATNREAHLGMKILAGHSCQLSTEIVEINPVNDEHNRTADLAMERACLAFGKIIQFRLPTSAITLVRFRNLLPGLLEFARGLG